MPAAFDTVGAARSGAEADDRQARGRERHGEREVHAPLPREDVEQRDLTVEQPAEANACRRRPAPAASARSRCRASGCRTRPATPRRSRGPRRSAPRARAARGSSRSRRRPSASIRARSRRSGRRARRSRRAAPARARRRCTGSRGTTGGSAGTPAAPARRPRPPAGRRGSCARAPRSTAAIVGGASISQPAVIGTRMRLARSLTKRARAAAVEQQMREEAGDDEEQAHPEGVDDVEGDPERRALRAVLRRDDEGRTTSSRAGRCRAAARRRARRRGRGSGLGGSSW